MRLMFNRSSVTPVDHIPINQPAYLYKVLSKLECVMNPLLLDRLVHKTNAINLNQRIKSQDQGEEEQPILDFGITRCFQVGVYSDYQNDSKSKVHQYIENCLNISEIHMLFTHHIGVDVCSSHSIVGISVPVTFSVVMMRFGHSRDQSIDQFRGTGLLFVYNCSWRS